MLKTRKKNFDVQRYYYFSQFLEANSRKAAIQGGKDA